MVAIATCSFASLYAGVFTISPDDKNWSGAIIHFVKSGNEVRVSDFNPSKSVYYMIRIITETQFTSEESGIKKTEQDTVTLSVHGFSSALLYTFPKDVDRAYVQVLLDQEPIWHWWEFHPRNRYVAIFVIMVLIVLGITFISSKFSSWVLGILGLVAGFNAVSAYEFYFNEGMISGEFSFGSSLVNAIYFTFATILFCVAKTIILQKKNKKLYR